MERAVVDASVAVKWFISEKDTDKALKLRDSYVSGRLELAAPTLIYYEVANALRFHPHYKLTEVELLDAVTELRDMQIAVEPTVEIWFKAFEISISQGISIYDAVYIATSLRLEAELVTGDKRLVEELSENIKQRIALLGEKDLPSSSRIKKKIIANYPRKP